jgi:hypothetical protein
MHLFLCHVLNVTIFPTGARHSGLAGEVERQQENSTGANQLKKFLFFSFFGN